jgi:hypothetical protein
MYREQILLPYEPGITSAPIVVEGNGAVLSGADVYSSWTAMGDGRYRTTWTHDLGNATDPWPGLSYNRVLLNREALFVGSYPGTFYFVTDDPTTPQAGTFYVDEATNTLTVRPRPEHVPLTSAEITVRGAPANRLVDVNGRRNVTFRNLTIERGAGAIQEAMFNVVNSFNLKLENITGRQAAGGGFALCCTAKDGTGVPGEVGQYGIVVRNLDAIDNGIQSFGVHRGSDVLLEDITLLNNNPRGKHAGFTGWAAGTKIGVSSRVTIRGWDSRKNYSHGMWFDYDNQNIVASDVLIAGNSGRGMFLEANTGPMTFTDTKVCNNGFSGISYARSDAVTLDGTTGTGVQVFGNRGWQHLVTGAASPVEVRPGVFVYGYNLTLRGVKTLGPADDWPSADSLGKNYLWWGGNLDQDPTFQSTLKADGNQWDHDASPLRFRMSAGIPGTVADRDHAAWTARFGDDPAGWTDLSALSCPEPRLPDSVDLGVGW